jgi:hypothetical protein
MLKIGTRNPWFFGFWFFDEKIFKKTATFLMIFLSKNQKPKNMFFGFWFLVTNWSVREREIEKIKK